MIIKTCLAMITLMLVLVGCGESPPSSSVTKILPPTPTSTLIPEQRYFTTFTPPNIVGVLPNVEYVETQYTTVDPLNCDVINKLTLQPASTPTIKIDFERTYVFKHANSEPFSLIIFHAPGADGKLTYYITTFPFCF